jgi:SM-20-related protein
MSILDIEAFQQTPLRHNPCEFLVVPNFIKFDRLEAINRDYPTITEPGNFELDQITYGPAFAELVAELQGPDLKAKFAEKFGIDLSENPLQLTVRKFSEAADGNVHNDSRTKIITVLIYFNERWEHEGGRLRLMKTPHSLDDYVVEVPPLAGMMLAFRRSETSFHGFKAFAGERRSLQMYWVKPKRQHRTNKYIGVKTWVKRLLKIRRR